MGFADFAFYVFGITVVLAGLLTVVARNPVHSVLWLILAFLSSAGLFVLLGAEFVAMLLIIVYVGAVAVLFLFVVMMAKYIPVAGLIGTVLLMQLALIFGSWQYSAGIESRLASPTPNPADVHNTAAIGQILYDDYILLFQASGLILLVAMVGAIVLTLRRRVGIKRQDVLAQMYRDPAKAMELKDVKPGQGL
jgi:NADH-quinone oxidoreductase subunit J